MGISDVLAVPNEPSKGDTRIHLMRVVGVKQGGLFDEEVLRFDPDHRSEMRWVLIAPTLSLPGLSQRASRILGVEVEMRPNHRVGHFLQKSCLDSGRSEGECGHNTHLCDDRTQVVYIVRVTKCALVCDRFDTNKTLEDLLAFLHRINRGDIPHPDNFQQPEQEVELVLRKD